MKTLSLALFAALVSAGAQAQSPSTPAPFELPEGCRGGGTMAMPAGMGNMDMPGADEAHRGLQQAMMRMNPAMMQGMSAKDPDVAFVCGMIAHHLGAVEMAKVQVRYGKDPEAKRMAEKSIKEQEEEAKEMTRWVQRHAGK